MLQSEREEGREATHSQGDQEMLERAIWTEQREPASLEIIGRRGDAVNETGPIGARWKEETDRRDDKKRVVWAAQRGQPASLLLNLQSEDGARARDRGIIKWGDQWKTPVPQLQTSF